MTKKLHHALLESDLIIGEEFEHTSEVGNILRLCGIGQDRVERCTGGLEIGKRRWVGRIGNRRWASRERVLEGNQRWTGRYGVLSGVRSHAKSNVQGKLGEVA